MNQAMLEQLPFSYTENFETNNSRFTSLMDKIIMPHLPFGAEIRFHTVGQVNHLLIGRRP